MSIILNNLHINYEGWRAELPQEQEEEGKGERKALEDGTGEEDKEGDVADEERVSTLCMCVYAAHLHTCLIIIQILHVRTCA